MSIQRCSNCNTLPKQCINKETGKYSLKCPNCKMKTTELASTTLALKEWNSTHVNKKD